MATATLQKYFSRQFCDQIFLQIKVSNGGGLEVLGGLYFDGANWPRQLELLSDAKNILNLRNNELRDVLRQSVPAWFSFAMSVCPLYHLKAQAGLANLRAQNTSQLKLLTQRHLRL